MPRQGISQRRVDRHRALSLFQLACAAAVAALTLICAAAAAPAARSATITVRAGQTNGGSAPERQFNAAAITIAAGDTVRWEWFADEHDVTAYDGSWTSPLLNGAGQSYSRTFPTAGTYTYYCDRHAGPSDARPDRIDEAIADGKMVGKITVNPAPSDVTGPATTGVSAAPNPSGGAASVTLTATVSDAASGGSNVAQAEYFVDAQGSPGTGNAMLAADGSFNSATEAITATVPLTGLPAGNHTLYVRGRDAAGNWGGFSSTVLNVSAAATLSLSARPVPFGAVQITGADQTLSAVSQPWRASDGRPSGDGWHITLQSTDFTATAGTIAAGNLKVRVDGADIVTLSGNAPPVSLVGSYQPLSAAPLRIISAATGTGTGSYDFTPQFQLTLPSSVYAGSYAASLTTSINSGP